MRIFWAIVALLVVIAAALLLMPARSAPGAASQRAAQSAGPLTESPAQTDRATDLPATNQNATTPPLAPPASLATTTPDVPPAPQATPTDLAAAADAEQAILDAIAAKHSGPQHAAKAARPTIESAQPDAGTAKIESDAAPVVVGTPTRAPAKLGEYVVTPAAFRTRDDGALVVDEKYVVRGEGTPEKPFVVTWEMLVASEGEFDPSKGKNTIPERVAMLHGKIVSISGYVAFPLMTPKPSELLMMLNQWDGCCMGVPPTPYDAIEVKINKPVTGDARFAVNGTVRGTFKVEPYVTKTPTVSWLNGLYLMENAEFAAADIGAGAGS